MRRSAFEGSNVIAKDLKDCCVIYAHHFSDSAHIYPNFIHDTFYDWLVDTTEQLDSLEQHFFIKPHPSQGKAEVEIIQDIVDKSSHGGLIDNFLSNNAIINSKIKFAVTVYGTICHELSFLGIPVLACSDNPHSSFTFNNQARSKTDYAKQLKFAVDNKLENKDDCSREAALFYSVHNYPPDWRDRLKMKKIRELRVALASEEFDIWPIVKTTSTNDNFG
jgi:hypothetical protein